MNVQQVGEFIEGRTQTQQLITMTLISADFNTNNLPILQLSFV